jgi:hypothetical protein
MYHIKERSTSYGTFAIFPTAGCWDEDNRLINQLGQVRARSKREAEYLAEKRGIGKGLQIWAIEVIAEDRVIPMTESNNDDYQAAKLRIQEMSFTIQEEEFIFTDWDGNFLSHIAWLLKATREEIRVWIDENK